MSRNWVAVASAEHVEIGRTGGFMQVCHGKATPLRRVQPGDRIVYYSPHRLYSASHAQRGKDRLQAFTALGTVKDGKPYQADMGFGFHPFRREVAWHEAEATPLAELHARLAFTQEKNWGYRLRQGLIEISDADMIVIAEAMFTDQASAPQARASSIALPSRSTISPTWSSVTMNGGASSTWSPRVPSIVPPMG